MDLGLFDRFKNETIIALYGPMDTSFDFNGPTIYIDGGVKHKNINHSPILSVGDGDSSLSDMDIKLNTEKEISDLEFVLQYLPLELECLHSYGFMGGEKDQEIHNLFAFYKLMNSRDSLRSINLDSHRYFPKGAHEIEVHGEFSLLTFEDTVMKVSGDVKYRCNDTCVTPFSSRALGNQGFGKVSIQCNNPILLYFRGL